MINKISIAHGIYVCALGILLICVSLYAGDTPFLESGKPLLEADTRTLYVLLHGFAALCGSLTLGSLILVGISSVPDKEGWVDSATYSIQRMMPKSAALWAIIALAMIPVSLAVQSGVGLHSLPSGSVFIDLMAASVEPYAWLVTAFFAVLVWGVTQFRARWTHSVVCVIPTTIALLAVPMIGNVAQGSNHDTTTTIAIVFYWALSALIGVKLLAPLRVIPSYATMDSSRRHSFLIQQRWITVVSVLAEFMALVWGLLLLLFLAPGEYIIHTVYGRAALALGVIVVVFLIRDSRKWWQLRDISFVVKEESPKFLPRTDGFSFTLTRGATLVLLYGLSTVHLYTAPALLNHSFSIWDVYLGYQLPGRVTLWNLLSYWRFDFFLGTACIVLALLYICGYISVRRQGIDWPVSKLVMWLIGCFSLLLGLNSGLSAYSAAMFSVHMGNHMLLNMMAPIWLVLGSPIKLALRALPAHSRDDARGPREWLLGFIHSGFSRFITHPAFTFILFVASLYIVYFTPLYGLFVRYHWWHIVVSIHFIISGYLFFWSIIGTDPGPRPLPYMARLGLLMGVMPFHAFFGIALMYSKNPIAGDFYSHLDLPWVNDLLRDQWLGGALAWGLSEVPIVVVAIAIGMQWYRHDQRVGRRIERQEKTGQRDDHAAYNDMLRALAERDRKREVDSYERG